MRRKPTPRLPIIRSRAGPSWRASALRPRWIVAAAAGLWLLSFLWAGRAGQGRALDSRQLAEQLSQRLASEALSQHTPAQLRQGFQTAIGSPNSTSSSGSIGGGAGGSSVQNSLLQMHLHNLVQQLTHGPSTVKCWVDPSLFQHQLRTRPAQRVLLAANMHNNEELLPHYIAQLVHMLALLPPGSAFLSIYESGSTDATGACSSHRPSCCSARCC